MEPLYIFKKCSKTYNLMISWFHTLSYCRITNVISAPEHPVDGMMLKCTDTHLWEPPAETGSLDHIVFAALPVPPVCLAHRSSPHPASARPVLGTWLAGPALLSLEMKQILEITSQGRCVRWSHNGENVIFSIQQHINTGHFIGQRK